MASRRGSSGAVFGSSDSRLGKVAIKFTHGEEQKKLEREAALMQRVAHEHVCKYYEHHVSPDGQLFGIVMEVLESGSLAQRIKESADGRIREFEVIQIAFDVLAGLAHMHDKGVIHRDIKPDNVLMASGQRLAEYAEAEDARKPKARRRTLGGFALVLGPRDPDKKNVQKTYKNPTFLGFCMMFMRVL